MGDNARTGFWRSLFRCQGAARGTRRLVTDGPRPDLAAGWPVPRIGGRRAGCGAGIRFNRLHGPAQSTGPEADGEHYTSDRWPATRNRDFLPGRPNLPVRRAGSGPSRASPPAERRRRARPARTSVRIAHDVPFEPDRALGDLARRPPGSTARARPDAAPWPARPAVVERLESSSTCSGTSLGPRGPGTPCRTRPRPLAGAVTVVQVDDGPGQQALGLHGLTRPTPAPPPPRRPGRVPAGGEQEVTGMSSSGSDMSLPNCSAGGSAIPM
jgi:hypothetical protein